MPLMHPTAWRNRRICTKRSRMLRYRPVPTSRTIIAGPQTMPEMASSNSDRLIGSSHSRVDVMVREYLLPGELAIQPAPNGWVCIAGKCGPIAVED